MVFDPVMTMHFQELIPQILYVVRLYQLPKQALLVLR